MRLADPAGGPAHLAELDQHVTADGIGIWPGPGRGEGLLQEPGGILPGPLASGAGGRLAGITDGLDRVAERACGQVVVGELSDVRGGARG